MRLAAPQCGKACLTVTLAPTLRHEAMPRGVMNYISPSHPAYYLTSVTKTRLPVFRHDSLKSIACKALNEARASGKFLILAYVIMPDHVHVITNGEKKAPVILRFINGIISRRTIDY